MTFVHKLIVLVALLTGPARAEPPPEGWTLSSVGQKLASTTGLGVRRIAVTEIVGLDGSRSPFGAFLSEEITTGLVGAGQFTVVERAQMAKIMEEQGFQQTDLADPERVRSLSKLAGAEALVVGTYTPRGGGIRLNIKMVKVETGQVLAVNTEDIPRNDVVNYLLGDASGDSGLTGVILSEDFRALPVGTAPKGWRGTENYATRDSERGRTFGPFKPGLALFTIPLPTPVTGDFRAEIGIILERAIEGNEYSFMQIGLGDIVAHVSLDDNYGNNAIPCIGEACGLAVSLNRQGAVGSFVVERRADVVRFLWNEQELAITRQPPGNSISSLQLLLTDPRATINHTSWVQVTKVVVSR